LDALVFTSPFPAYEELEICMVLESPEITFNTIKYKVFPLYRPMFIRIRGSFPAIKIQTIEEGPKVVCFIVGDGG
jgi:hypothetical protein